MIDDEQLQRLVLKWTHEGDTYRAEVRRLESSDRCRHATSIAMLEARAQAIDRCILEVQSLAKF